MLSLTIPKLADELFLRPIVISMNSLALSALMSYVMSANGRIDWRPMIVCVTSDILAIGADHLKDKEEEFSLDRTTTNDPYLTCAVLLALVLSQCPFSTLLTTAMFVVPALLWTTPISFKSDRHQPSTSAPVLVIKRIPGMKAIFNGIIRGYGCKPILFRCGIYAVVFSVLSGSGNLISTLPSPWSVVQLIVWSTVNRSCHAIMTDVRVPTIPVLLGSILKTKVILTVCHMLVMLAFIENTYIMGSCLFAAVLVWILGKDSPKKAFLFSSHSQSLFTILYLLTRQYPPL
ncbi:uncharacterized protein F5891DRAFT_1125661 [Suillus fuscotomentosus]|uniref:Uncharacterized protein n=1 Tax=Suillus fuscotomentosus TaxID=1912939 RepID=A0AAD4EHT5_9AGAM|nr:uncharacterized protein F5891DRAFT_1125661 [Suillus fuscotomentosus]KAG1906332.1 hypothetical protein F5891DRAFT_1125661 [Suillus fuscotomentosus]